MPTFEVSITMKMSRDESCDQYSYTEISRVGLSEMTRSKMRNLIATARENFENTLPWNINLGTFYPIDVVVREVD